MSEQPEKKKDKTSGSSQGPFSVWQGMTFSTWLRFLAMRPPMDWSQAFRIALCTGCSMSNSVFGLAERLLYGRQIQNVKFPGPPVFVLGHWRSGTTWLHNMLAEDQRFATPNTYQVINPHHFILTESTITKFTKWMLPATRPMDNVKVSFTSPQEDEMALLNLTLISPYFLLAFQGDRKHYADFFDLENLSESDREFWKREFLYFLKKVSLKSGGKQMLLKSPTHSYRIPILLDMFPDAYFINIVRNPYAVYSSSVHLRKKLFVANGLARPNFVGMEEDMSVCYEELFKRYHATRHLVPKGRLYELRYEELEQDPVGEMRKIYEYFQWPNFEVVENAILTQLDGLRDFKKNEFHLDPEVQRRVYNRFQNVFERYGYPSKLEDETQQVPVAKAS
jgi:LPS sulfotransferase NodH